MLNQIMADLKSRKPHVVAKMAEVHQVIGQATVDRQLAVCDLSIDAMQLTAHQIELVRSRANVMAKEPEKARVMYQIAEDLMHRDLEELKEIAQLHAVNKHRYQADSISPFVREVARIMQRMADVTKVGMITEIVREAVSNDDYLRQCVAMIAGRVGDVPAVARCEDPAKVSAVRALVGCLMSRHDVTAGVIRSIERRMRRLLGH